MNKTQQNYLFERIDSIKRQKESDLYQLKILTEKTKIAMILDGRARFRNDLIELDSPGYLKFLDGFVYPWDGLLSPEEYSAKVENVRSYAVRLKDQVVLGEIPDMIEALSTFSTMEF